MVVVGCCIWLFVFSSQKTMFHHGREVPYPGVVGGLVFGNNEPVIHEKKMSPSWICHVSACLVISLFMDTLIGLLFGLIFS